MNYNNNITHRNNEIFDSMVLLLKNPGYECNNSKLIRLLQNRESKAGETIKYMISLLNSLDLDLQLKNKVMALTISFTNVPPQKEIMDSIPFSLENLKSQDKKTINLMISFSINFKSEEHIMESMISLLQDTKLKLQNDKMMDAMLCVSMCVKSRSSEILKELND